MVHASTQRERTAAPIPSLEIQQTPTFTHTWNGPQPHRMHIKRRRTAAGPVPNISECFDEQPPFGITRQPLCKRVRFGGRQLICEVLFNALELFGGKFSAAPRLAVGVVHTHR